MADVVLRSQSAGVCPDTEEARISLREVVRSDPEMGSVMTRAVRDVPIRSFKLRWSSASESERYLLEKAFDDAKGFVKAMDYTPVGDVDANKVEVHFLPGTVQVTQTAPDLYEMVADVEEVI